jgi:outer membrane protein assembly factor BamA
MASTYIVVAQNKYKLSVMNTDSEAIFKKIDYKKEFQSLTDLNKELNVIYLSLLENGYVMASIDSLKNDSLNYLAYVVCGKKHTWVDLHYHQNQKEVITKLGYNEHFFSKRPFRYTEVATLMEKMIVYYENNGYPFALAKLDSLQFKNETVSAHIKVEKNIFIKLDSLVIDGNVVVHQKFISRYLNIKNGMPYNERAFNSVSSKIKQLPFLVESKPAILKLTNKQNKLFLFLDKRNASQFDGIVGILPDNKGKTIITGDLKIKLVNSLLKNGETVDLNWRRLQSQTQDLKLNLIYPYLFGLPFGADYGIKLYKKDSAFIDVNNTIGFNYYYSGLNHVKAFYKQRNANLISTNGLSSITVLPDYADIQTKSYGLGFLYEKFDYRFNPKKGFSCNIIGSIGNREIKKNQKINDAAYADVALKSSQYQLEFNTTAYLKIYKNNIIKISTQLASLFGNVIYKNELFRIGGLRTLRGFDEESIYASTYVIPTIEYRFLFEKNSNIFIFAEGAWYENNSNNNYLNDTPLSFGAGINFETKAGIFNLGYALGKQRGNNFELQTGKIHAGLTALF